MGARTALLAASRLHVRSAESAPRRRDFEAQALVHLDALYRTALRLTQSRPEAEDLVQDACLRAFTHFDQFEPGTNCRAWLFTILHNIFLNRIRGRGHEVLDDDSKLGLATASVTAPSSDNPEAEFFRRTLPADVEGALSALPLVFREAVVLVDLEGVSYKEAAQALECPVGTVMSRLWRSRRLLRRALQPAGAMESPEEAQL